MRIRERFQQFAIRVHHLRQASRFVALLIRHGPPAPDSGGIKRHSVENASAQFAFADVNDQGRHLQRARRVDRQIRHIIHHPDPRPDRVGTCRRLGVQRGRTTVIDQCTAIGLRMHGLGIDLLRAFRSGPLQLITDAFHFAQATADTAHVEFSIETKIAVVNEAHIQIHRFNLPCLHPYPSPGMPTRMLTLDWSGVQIEGIPEHLCPDSAQHLVVYTCPNP
ncbi:hypothetical protein D3C81_849600 [compost metagenome]